VIGAVEAGASRRRAAAVFKVSISTVIRWAKRVTETGSYAPLPSGGDHKSKDVEAHKDWLLSVITAKPDLTLEEIQGRLKAAHGLPKSQSGLWRFFARHDITLKKTAHAAEQDRPDVKHAREVWRDNQHKLNPDRLIFLDETSVSTNMARLRGRCLGGERLIGKVPYGH